MFIMWMLFTVIIVLCVGRLLHNFTRYSNHKKALVIAKEKLKELEAGEFATCSSKGWAAKAHWLREAFEQVVHCRRALQYSYVVGYFAEHGTQEHTLFEFQQQMLESNAEALNHLTEKAEKHRLDLDELKHVSNLTG